METLLNMGSIQKIEIAFAENITISIPDDSNQVSVTNSGSWDVIDFTLETASFAENEKPVKEGVVYESQLKWQIPRISPTQHAVAHKYTNKKIALRITDANGTVIIIGNNKVPAYVNLKKQIPAKASEFNGYNFNVNYQSARPAYFVA